MDFVVLIINDIIYSMSASFGLHSFSEFNSLNLIINSLTYQSIQTFLFIINCFLKIIIFIFICKNILNI
jgi:hypothetical protein